MNLSFPFYGQRSGKNAGTKRLTFPYTFPNNKYTTREYKRITSKSFDLTRSYTTGISFHIRNNSQRENSLSDKIEKIHRHNTRLFVGNICLENRREQVPCCLPSDFSFLSFPIFFCQSDFVCTTWCVPSRLYVYLYLECFFFHSSGCFLSELLPSCPVWLMHLNRKGQELHAHISRVEDSKGINFWDPVRQRWMWCRECSYSDTLKWWLGFFGVQGCQVFSKHTRG